MKPLWTSSEIADAVKGEASAAFDVDGVAFDSREIGKGDLFFALKGEQSDGHQYVDQAHKAGSAGAIVSQSFGSPHIRVSDTTKALNRLGQAARARTDAKIIGVTGSVGKTGVKEALFAALDRCSMGKAHRSLKSYNNHVGVPLSLSRMPANTQYGVFEMGMNHAGELSRLTQLVRPDAAIVTAIAPAHIGHFKNEEAIADAKGEIFEGLTDGGTAIIPFDSRHYQRLDKKARQHASHVVSFGMQEGADVRAIDVVPAPSHGPLGGGSLVTASLGDHNLCFTVSAPGAYWVSNALAILAAVKAVGGDLASAGLALAELEGLDGRGRRYFIGLEGMDPEGEAKALLIDESYNANPVSMKATLAQLRQEPCEGKKIAILGAMGELGDKARSYHEALADDIAEAGVVQVILVGDDMSYTADRLAQLGLEPALQISQAADASDAFAMVAKAIGDGDVLLIKGSNYLGLSTVVTGLVNGE